MVMVTRNEKPTKKGSRKANETTRDQITDANNRTTCAQVTYYKEYPLHKEATDLLPEQTQDS
jgi:hypothetical protein